MVERAFLVHAIEEFVQVPKLAHGRVVGVDCLLPLQGHAADLGMREGLPPLAEGDDFSQCIHQAAQLGVVLGNTDGAHAGLGQQLLLVA
ncbi:hypothetical protein D3C85_1546210 [compost metagenome]